MLTGKKTRLRAMEPKDAAYFYEAINNPLVTEYLLVNTPMSHADEADFIEHMRASSNDCVFTVEDIRGEAPAVVGVCGAHRVDRQNGTAYSGIFIGDPNLFGQGLGRDAFYVLTKFLHEELRINRVEIDVRADHAAAKKCYEALGFQQEGVRRQAVFSGGEYQDLILMSCLPGELIEPEGQS